MYAAVGSLDERVSGRSWEDLTRDRLFKPLGMTRSNFSVADSQRSDDFALPYDKIRGEVRRIPFYPIESVAPAGAINSNVEEMIRYVRFHLDLGTFEGKTILSPASARRLQSPQSVVPDPAAGHLHSPEFPELGHLSYGLGFFVTTYRGRPVVWHSGSIDGFGALMTMLPGEKAGVIVLTNLDGNRPAPTCVTRRILDELLGLDPVDWFSREKEADRKAERDEAESKAKEAAKSEPASSPSHALADYAGTFEHPAYGPVAVSTTGGGLAIDWRKGTVALDHERFDVFEANPPPEDFNPIPKVRVTFGSGADGTIDRLTMPLEPAVAEIAFARKSPAPAPGYDLIIRNGRVVDGSGNPWFLGDVAVRGDTIVRVAPAGMLKEAPARRSVDASGMVVAPGFIDIQGHSRQGACSTATAAWSARSPRG